MSTVTSFRRFGLMLFTLGVILLPFVTDARLLGSSEPQSSSEKKKEVTVWAITTSKVYHCPDSRWYGKTAPGKEVGECQAVRDGYRPAFGRGCGSECTKKPEIDSKGSGTESQTH